MSDIVLRHISSGILRLTPLNLAYLRVRFIQHCQADQVVGLARSGSVELGFPSGSLGLTMSLGVYLRIYNV